MLYLGFSLLLSHEMELRCENFGRDKGSFFNLISIVILKKRKRKRNQPAKTQFKLGIS